jgi:GntR family transcriptional repressor for pyruvate dehydrogenase complex
MRASLDDHEAFVESDVAFHQRLAVAAGNTALRDIHSSVQALLRTWIRRVIEAAPSSVPSFEEHVPIFEAVKAGDPEAAERAMDRHMTLAAERLAESLPGAEIEPLAATADGPTRGATTL